MARERLVLVGNGMAGLKFLEEVLELAPGRFDITVIGAEPEPAYNRVLLSSLLAGEIAAGDVTLKSRAWYGEHGIVLKTGQPAVALDSARREVVLADGVTVPFDVLVLATGSNPIRLDLPGQQLSGVTTFRTLADVADLKAAAGAKTAAVVIGGGLLGIEAAYGLARRRVPVTLVHLMDRLMERQLDAEGAALLKDALEARGIKVLLQAQTRAIHGEGAVESVELADGRRIACGLVVMAVGVRPNVALAATGGLQIGRGILVDDRLQTSVADIHAIGECVEHRSGCYGLVEPAYEQARVAAAAIVNKPVSYLGSVLATNLKVSGVPVFSAGDFEGAGAEAIIVRDHGAASYRKLVIRDGRLAGAALVGDTGDALWYAELIRTAAPVAAFREALAFGQAFAEAMG
ncbi:MAG: NAD(P)/FAD-dependent oxidoreductase [Hyphomicrobiaceae bacterium]|nr:MAG: NAD(P)/FAD-dependent oxidoreductase [Hyphomicrobiaceae bacterium]